MSHCTVQYANTQAKIGAPGSTWTLATARMPATKGKPTTAGTRATAGTKATTWMPTTPGKPEKQRDQ
jgi:hypothetical protein